MRDMDCKKMCLPLHHCQSLICHIKTESVTVVLADCGDVGKLEPKCRAFRCKAVRLFTVK